MKNEEGLIVVKAERQIENFVRRMKVFIEDGKIILVKEDEISLSDLKAGKDKGNWPDKYTPEEDPFIFRRMLYTTLDIWEKDKNAKAKEEMLSYLSQEEIEKYFGKYGRPASFYIQKRVTHYNPVNYTIRILDGKIFEIKEERIFPSGRREIGTLKEDEIKASYLSEVISFLVSTKGWGTYKEFLSCLCKEELQKYFVPSYLPK